MLKEFREFAMRGNVMDLAIGVIIGAAFGAIVSSLVDNILMPLIGLITGGINLKSLSFSVRDAKVQYGMFLQNVVNFLIIAFSVFMIVKVLNRMKRPAQEPETASTMKDCPYCMSSIPILATRCPHCTSELKA
jgi:large conductance mechanosensitive channel